jgi:phage shock protein A
LAKKQSLLGKLASAKVKESMNDAMAQLQESVGKDGPSLTEVEEKIQARYAKATAIQHLDGTSVQASMLEIEQATSNVAAQDRLSQMRQTLGLSSGAPAPMALPAVESEVKS